MVLSDEWNGPWLQVDGTAEVLDLPAALEPLVDYFRAISGEHPDWTSTAGPRWSPRASRCCGSPRPTRGPIATGGFPARLADLTPDVSVSPERRPGR